MARLLALALVSAGGFVGMLLVGSSFGDTLLLALAALPLAYGGWRLGRSRKISSSTRQAAPGATVRRKGRV